MRFTQQQRFIKGSYLSGQHFGFASKQKDDASTTVVHSNSMGGPSRTSEAALTTLAPPNDIFKQTQSTHNAMRQFHTLVMVQTGGQGKVTQTILSCVSRPDPSHRLGQHLLQRSGYRAANTLPVRVLALVAIHVVVPVSGNCQEMEGYLPGKCWVSYIPSKNCAILSASKNQAPGMGGSS